MKKFVSSFSLIALVMMAISLIFTSCSDDDEVQTVYYSAGFDSLQSSSDGFMQELSVIENTFLQSLGVAQSPFALTGTVEECDAEVRSACQSAAITLSGKTWNGTYKFTVINNTTETVVYTFENHVD